MRFIFIRHAESEGNRGQFIAGPETPLTAEGLRDAEAFAQTFTAPLGAVFSSPYRRTLQTAEPLARKLGMTVIRSDDLAEKNFGSLGGKPQEDVARTKEPHPEYRDPVLGYDYHAWGGESGADVAARIRHFVETVKREHPAAAIAAFTHRAVIRLIHVLYGNREYAERLPIPNISIHEFDL